MTTLQDSPFIAVDWGTSTFRAALIAHDGEIVDELAESRGILSFKQGEFANYLIATCARFTQAGGRFFLLSGMIGSKNGLAEIPYCPCPATAGHLALMVGWAVKDRVAIVPGIRSEFFDVMRGEETQVFGALLLLDLADARLVLPGTHSKWVNVTERRITDFSTWMTGEFYALLRQHSILARTLPASDPEPDADAFDRGVDHALHSQGLLHTAFSVRTLALFDRMPADALSSYLSGLMIGEELKSQTLKRGDTVVVMGSEVLTARYEQALAHLGVSARRVGDGATWRGLRAIADTVASA